MATNEHDLLIIGAGPGGYVAAIRAAQLGLNVGCIEKESVAGGTCLRVGCIPSKALLESSEKYWEARHALAAHGIKTGPVELDLAAMLKRKSDVVNSLTKGVDGLLRKNKVTRYPGHGRIRGPGLVEVSNGDATQAVRARNILIATGSRSAELKGVAIDGDRIATSTEALSYAEVPNHLVVIGAGYIGLELGSVWARLGAQVTVLEYLDRILPGMDAELAADALKIFKKQGLAFRLSCKVTSAKLGTQGRGGPSPQPSPAHNTGEGDGGEKCVVECEGGEPIECDRVLLAVGRVANTQNLGLESLQIKLDERGRISVDDHFATSAPNVFAIGDVIRGPMLAHKAEDEGVACVEYLVTGHGHVDYNTIPGVCYTDPEIASVGKTEEQLAAEKTEYRKGVFPFLANGRARALGRTDGKVKVLADKTTDRVLGVHIIGPRAGDLIAEAAAAMAFGASSEDIARCCHAHPTLAESLKEAALAVDQRAIHI